MMLPRRTLLITAPVVALISKIGHGEAVPHPQILTNEIWQRPSARATADELRRAITEKIAGHYIGAYRSPMTVKRRLGARYSLETEYDARFIKELVTILAAEVADDLARHRQIFCDGAPIQLVALDGCCAIDPWSFQPVLDFYIERN